MRNFKKVLMSALVTGLALSASADVFAQRGGADFNFNDRDSFERNRSGNRNGGGRFNHGHRNRGPQFQIESEYIGQTFYPGDKLFLGRELGLRGHKGKEVEKVELEIEGMRRGGTMTLLINGQQASRVQHFRGGRVGDQVITFNLRRPFIIGENLRRIQVQFEGTAYVREALVVLKKKGRGHGPRKIEKHVYKDVIGMEEINLSELVDANYRQEERETRFVELEFHSYDRANQIRVCDASPSFGFDGRIHFDRRPIGHRNLVDLDLRIGRPGRGNDRGHSRRCDNTQLVQGRGQQKLRIFTDGKKLKDIALMIRGDLTLEKVTVGLK